MANPNPKLENLTSYKPKWQSGKTRTIRVPIAIAPLVLEAAQEIDTNGNISLLKQIEELKQQNQKLLAEKQNQSENISDTSELKYFLFVKKEIKETVAKGFATRANKGGEIKKCLAHIATLLGYKVKRNSNQVWTIKN